MWIEELGYRLGFACKKIVIWKEFRIPIAN